MLSETFAKKDIDYLQRRCDECKPSSFSSIKSVQTFLKLWNIKGVGYTEKFPSPTREYYTDSKANAPRLPSEDIIIGFYGIGKPIALIIEGKPDKASIYLGAWARNEPIVYNSTEFFSILHSFYPYVAEDSKVFDNIEMKNYTQAGLVVGTPSIKNPDILNSALPFDRLIRAMSDGHWLCAIFAEPWSLEKQIRLRDKILEDLGKSYYKYKDSSSLPSYTLHCSELLNSLLATHSQGLSIGSWRTTTYLIGDDVSYSRLANVWRSIFSGDQSNSDPIQIWDSFSIAKENKDLLDLALNYKVPEEQGIPCQGINLTYRHPFRYQSLLNSSQLAAYIHLPRYETSGFSVSMLPDFDVVPPPVNGSASIEIGKVLHRRKKTKTPYKVELNALTRHTLVVGVTGSGKTNTCFKMLNNLWQKKIPFLVIEPAKTEYRSLINDPIIGPDLQVFTLGRELLSPFRLNPFEFEEGVLLSTHIDLLKSVFNAAFSMWTVLPQILEQALHRVYKSYSWDIVRNENKRLADHAGERAETFPILQDLQDVIIEIVNNLGYSSESTNELKAALITRIQSLRIGGKGKMLDTRSSFSMCDLLKRPTILELEDVGDDDEKAFIMGLIMVKLYEYLRANKTQREKTLRHLVVIEEAHRLLANIPTKTSSEQANARGKAVETFVNMLSEVRAYGEGFWVAEQIPTKLAPDLIKNTNLKIIHRIVEGDERFVMSHAMNMKEHHSDMLTTLDHRNGEAVVFAEGDDLPIMIRVEEYKNKEIEFDKLDGMIKKAMRERMPKHFPGFELDCFAGCNKYAGIETLYCDSAQEISENHEIQRMTSYLILSTVEMPECFSKALTEFVESIYRDLDSDTLRVSEIQSILIHSMDANFKIYSKKYNWNDSAALQLKKEILPISIQMINTALSEAKSTVFDSKLLKPFQKRYKELCALKTQPFEFCDKICHQKPSPYCLFRFHAEKMLHDSDLDSHFQTALKTTKDIGIMKKSLFDHSIQCSQNYLSAELLQESRTRFALCYAMQKSIQLESVDIKIRHEIVRKLLDYAQTNET